MRRRRWHAILLALTAVYTLARCQSTSAPIVASPLPTCGQITIGQVVEPRILRLADGTLVELVAPHMFLQAPSPEQTDAVALNRALVAYLKAHLDGRTVTGDLVDAKLTLCGKDLVALGTGLVSQGLLFVEQVTGPLDSDSLATWNTLEYAARQNRLGLWKKGDVGPSLFDRVARLTFRSQTGEQTLDEITYNGTLPGRGVTMTPERLAQFHAIVAGSTVTLLPRSPNFWRLCCDIGGSWFRIYYPPGTDGTQAADYIESPGLETFFRQVFDDTAGDNR